VIVIDATFPTPFDSETLYGRDKALAEDLTYWIAAELEPAQLKAGEEAAEIGLAKFNRNFLLPVLRGYAFTLCGIRIQVQCLHPFFKDNFDNFFLFMTNKSQFNILIPVLIAML
jgi:hypothetical protein